MRTEDDIRAAFRTLARQAPDTDAVLTAVRERIDTAIAGPGQAGRRSVRRRMTQLAAAAAVIAVTAAAVAIADGQPQHPGPTTSGSLLHRLPRYYMTLLIPARHWSGTGAPRIVVKDTRTGATLVTARPPAPYHTFAGITGAADDRTFVLAARPASVAVTENGQDTEKLFRARLNPAQGTLTMTPLRIPVFTPGTQLDGMALSPDGTELAVAMQTGRGHQQLVIRLYSLAGRLLKTWHSHGILGDFWLNPAIMSWTRTGVLAINWTYYGRNSRGAVYRAGLWLLNTSSADGGLAVHSRLVVPSNVLPGFYVWGASLLSSDGGTVVAPMIAPDRDSGKIEEFSAATGEPIRALWPVHFGGPDAPGGFPAEVVMWSNAAGSVLVAQANLRSGRSNGRTGTGVLSGRHFTPIPGAPLPDPQNYGLVF